MAFTSLALNSFSLASTHLTRTPLQWTMRWVRDHNSLLTPDANEFWIVQCTVSEHALRHASTQDPTYRTCCKQSHHESYYSTKNTIQATSIRRAGQAASNSAFAFSTACVAEVSMIWLGNTDDILGHCTGWSTQFSEFPLTRVHGEISEWLHLASCMRQSSFNISFSFAEMLLFEWQHSYQSIFTNLLWSKTEIAFLCLKDFW